MKFRQKILFNDTFPIKIGYQELGTSEQFMELAKESQIISSVASGTFAMPEGNEATTYVFGGGDSLIWAHQKLPKPQWREVVTHEALHATMTAMSHIGIGVCSDEEIRQYNQEEPFCYFQQWILRELGVFK